MYNQHADDDATSAGHKSQALPAAANTADTIAMEKFTHVAEKFVQKSVKAALAPYKEAIMRFSQIQMDTVRWLARHLRAYFFFCFSCCFYTLCSFAFRSVSDLLLIARVMVPLFLSCRRHRMFDPTRTMASDPLMGPSAIPHAQFQPLSSVFFTQADHTKNNASKSLEIRTLLIFAASNKMP
jgi:hypothetical protein